MSFYVLIQFEDGLLESNNMYLFVICQHISWFWPIYLLVYYIGYEDKGMSHEKTKRKLEAETRAFKE
jgi:hypothetical protein